MTGVDSDPMGIWFPAIVIPAVPPMLLELLRSSGSKLEFRSELMELLLGVEVVELPGIVLCMAAAFSSIERAEELEFPLPPSKLPPKRFELELLLELPVEFSMLASELFI